MDEFFNYLRTARIGGLQKIAQDLGAKHFKVTYKEEKRQDEKKNVKGKMHGKNQAGKMDASVDQEGSTKEYSTIRIAAEMECIGHSPIEPELIYFKKDPQIQSLVALPGTNMRARISGITAAGCFSCFI